MKRNAAVLNLNLDEDSDANLAPIDEPSINFPRLVDLKGSQQPHRGLEISPDVMEAASSVELAHLVDADTEPHREPPTDPGLLPGTTAQRPRESSREVDTGGITITQPPLSTATPVIQVQLDTTAVANGNLVLIHEGSGKIIRIFDGLVIGRSEGNENFPQDSLISRKHCRLNYSSDNRRVLVEDLETTNPTRINGTDLKPHQRFELRVGDIIEVGNQRLSVGDRHTQNAFEDLPFPVSRRNGVVFMPKNRRAGSAVPRLETTEDPSPASLSAEEPARVERKVPNLFNPATWDTLSLVTTGLLLILYGASVISYLAQMNEVTSPLHDPARLRAGLLSSLFWPTGITILLLYRLLNFECKSMISKGMALLAGFWIYVLSSYFAQHQNRAIFQIQANTINEFCVSHFDEARCVNSLNQKASSVAEVLKELPDGTRARVVSLIDGRKPSMERAPAGQTTASAEKLPL